METIERFKHIALAILLVIAGISFAACSSDNEEGDNGDDNVTKNFDIVGTWKCFSHKLYSSSKDMKLLN